ncbi:hypothetical protein RUM43_003462 [Polyplax serrata]|uniref:Uncharacterized protein n=1 Tax=Polyplax serrata TaxID=468196 RepID=A0AAN8S377_POLSC
MLRSFRTKDMRTHLGANTLRYLVRQSAVVHRQPKISPGLQEQSTKNHKFKPPKKVEKVPSRRTQTPEVITSAQLTSSCVHSEGDAGTGRYFIARCYKVARQIAELKGTDRPSTESHCWYPPTWQQK